MLGKLRTKAHTNQRNSAKIKACGRRKTAGLPLHSFLACRQCRAPELQSHSFMELRTSMSPRVWWHQVVCAIVNNKLPIVLPAVLDGKRPDGGVVEQPVAEKFGGIVQPCVALLLDHF